MRLQSSIQQRSAITLALAFFVPESRWTTQAFHQCGVGVRLVNFQTGCRTRLQKCFGVASEVRGLASTTRLPSHLQLNLITPEENEEQDASEDDLARWERMYEEGKLKNPLSAVLKGALAGENSEPKSNVPCGSEVRVVSFDLDNTLWKTSETIDGANEALASFLQLNGISPQMRVENFMKELFSEKKAEYCPIDTDQAKGPVLLTKLRKDAIRVVLEKNQDLTPLEVDELIEESFQVWVSARHDLIAKNLAYGVGDTLRSIRALETSEGKQVVVGAITDGNSNPRLVAAMADSFDFVVNAEEVGIGKPDKRIYLQAVRHVLLNTGTMTAEETANLSEDELQKMIGPWWVHVGDDFVKDVVAANGLNMRSIWVRELIQGSTQKIAREAVSSKRTVSDLVRDTADQAVIEMAVGAGDYLTDSLQHEFADAVVDRFADILHVLSDWHLGVHHQPLSPPRTQKKPATELPSSRKTSPQLLEMAEPRTVPTVTTENTDTRSLPPAKPAFVQQPGTPFFGETSFTKATSVEPGAETETIIVDDLEEVEAAPVKPSSDSLQPIQFTSVKLPVQPSLVEPLAQPASARATAQPASVDPPAFVEPPAQSMVEPPTLSMVEPPAQPKVELPAPPMAEPPAQHASVPSTTRPSVDEEPLQPAAEEPTTVAKPPAQLVVEESTAVLEPHAHPPSVEEPTNQPAFTVLEPDQPTAIQEAVNHRSVPKTWSSPLEPDTIKPLSSEEVHGTTSPVSPPLEPLATRTNPPPTKFEAPTRLPTATEQKTTVVFPANGNVSPAKREATTSLWSPSEQPTVVRPPDANGTPVEHEIATRLSPSEQATVARPVGVHSKSERKFCLFCGTNLPKVAKFCSSCGKEQIE